jgi:microcystin-dependent protein
LRQMAKRAEPIQNLPATRLQAEGSRGDGRRLHAIEDLRVYPTHAEIAGKGQTCRSGAGNKDGCSVQCYLPLSSHLINAGAARMGTASRERPRDFNRREHGEVASRGFGQ